MQFQKGQSGNPAGRPRGSRNKSALLAEVMFSADASLLIEQLIHLAKEGNIDAVRLCIQRICPPQRERPIALDLPPLTTTADAVAAMGAIVQSIGDGDLSAQEAAELAKVVAGFSQTIVTAELDQLMCSVEEKLELLTSRGQG